MRVDKGIGEREAQGEEIGHREGVASGKEYSGRLLKSDSKSRRMIENSIMRNHTIIPSQKLSSLACIVGMTPT